MLRLRFAGLLFTVAASCAFAQTGSPFGSSVWCGNVTPTSANVVARFKAPGLAVRLQVSSNPLLSPAVFSEVGTTDSLTGNAVKLSVQGLQPDTDYYYGIEVDGALRADPESRGRFRTFPVGRASFKIAFASCSDYRKADQSVFSALIAERPLLFIHMGDLHYADTDSTNAEDYRANYDSVLNQPQQAAFYRSAPLAYIWDDHDYSGNDSDGRAIGRDAARAVYRERVPHYPMAPVGGPIAQAFTIGRVRVIMTDLRSASSAPQQEEGPAKSRMGAAQKAWFKQELILARDAGVPLTLWVCSQPWIGQALHGDDSWAGFATERAEIANFIRDNGIANLVLLSGDMHGLAFDDGTNSDYATGGGVPLKVLHAASLTTDGAIKGGPYSAGPFLGAQQYGILEVFDAGGANVTCRFSGKKAGEGEKLNYVFNSSATGDTSAALANISTLAQLRPGIETLTSGFVVSGQNPRRLVVRAVGPSLAPFGVSDALERPHLTVFRGDQAIASNEGWANGRIAASVLTAIFDRVGAFRLLSDNSRDAALVLTLKPGAYTVQVRSADGRPGTTLLEVYDAP